jgi:transposase
MEELVKLIDENLEYEGHETSEEYIVIRVKSVRTEIACPFCGEVSGKVHSVYERKFEDMPVCGKKVQVMIKNKKYFCRNAECSNTTFAETYDFLPYNGRRSKRLTEEIIRVSREVSSVKASELLSQSVTNVGKSTICELLKKSRDKD